MIIKLEKEKTASTPYVLADGERNYLKFEGKSFIEDAAAFYGEIIDWLDAFLAGDFGSFTFDCDLKYFNSSTAKLLYQMLRDLDNAAGCGRNICVNWITDGNNAVSTEIAEDFMEELHHLKFNLILN